MKSYHLSLVHSKYSTNTVLLLMLFLSALSLGRSRYGNLTLILRHTGKERCCKAEKQCGPVLVVSGPKNPIEDIHTAPTAPRTAAHLQADFTLWPDWRSLFLTSHLSSPHVAFHEPSHRGSCHILWVPMM